jgi:hypothetical protein
MSVFEHVVYHSACLDPSNPSRPTLEIDAVVREGDVDDGPVLLPWADFVFMVGKPAADRCYPGFVEAGRIVDHLDVKHLAFPLWTAGEIIHR